MSRTYEQLWTILEASSGDNSETLMAFRDRIQSSVKILRETPLATEDWRLSRERVYADMYAQCAGGLGSASSGATLSERIVPAAHHAHAADQLRAVLRRRFCGTVASPTVESLVARLMDYFRQEQAIVRAACEIQQPINRILGRTPPTRPFTASDIDIYNQINGGGARLPDLADELQKALGLRIVVTEDSIEISDR